MRLAIKIALAATASLVLGIGSAALSIRMVALRAAVHNGAWTINLATGSTEADMYTRAAVSVGGLFALDRKETIYYTAFTDDDDQPLRGQCDYLLQGQDLAARWWSFTAYGEDHFLIPNDANRHSYNLKNLERKKDGSYEVVLSAEHHEEGNWLPTGSAGEFSITLRLYNPAPDTVAQAATIELPRIKRTRCP